MCAWHQGGGGHARFTSNTSAVAGLGAHHSYVGINKVHYVYFVYTFVYSEEKRASPQGRGCRNLSGFQSKIPLEEENTCVLNVEGDLTVAR